MLPIAPVIKLLRQPTTVIDKWFRSIEGDYEYARIDGNNVPTPAAWVLPKTEQVIASGGDDDEIEIQFDVVIAIDQRVKRNDDDADELLRKYRREVYRRLRGKKLANDQTAMKLVGGRILRTTDRDVMWVETYKFTGSISNYLDEPPPFETVQNKGNRL